MDVSGDPGKEDTSPINLVESQEQFEPNPDFLKSLLEMGISKDIAEKALRKTMNASVELAVAVAMEDDGDDYSDVEENYKMVFVVNASLNMSLGKTAAQVAHGALGLYRLLVNDPEQTADLYAWQDIGEKKIVLRGEDEKHLLELHQKASGIKVPSVVIRDAGHTEIAPNSLTVLALFGEEKNVDKVTRELRLLQ